MLCVAQMVVLREGWRNAQGCRLNDKGCKSSEPNSKASKSKVVGGQRKSGGMSAWRLCVPACGTLLVNGSHQAILPGVRKILCSSPPPALLPAHSHVQVCGTIVHCYN
jgi:hypothetical protein